MKRFIAIAFQLYFLVCKQEGSGIWGWFESEWYTSGLFRADYVNMWNCTVRAIEKNIDAVLVISKEIGIEVNCE